MANVIKSRVRFFLSEYPLLLLGIAILLLLSFFYSPPLSIQEINTLVASKSVLAGNLSNNSFLDFAKSNLFFVSPLPVVINMFFELILPHSLILAKIPNIVILLSLYILYNKFLLKDVAKKSSKLVGIVLLVLLVTSPWLIQAAIYSPSNLISLAFFVLSAVYLKKAFFDKTSQENDKRLFFASLILLSLSSIQGLIASLTMLLTPLIFVFKAKKAKTRKAILPFLVVSVLILGNILVNRDSLFAKFNQGSIFTKVSLSKLSQDIDERQKIDYLSSNKNFILPPLVRKFTYNKLSLAADRVIRKSISLLDFEHLASPNESYDIVKLSGILPKGNLPLYYIWEFPIIAFGAYELLRKRRSLRSWYVLVLASSLIPAIIFEKRDLPEFGIFTHASLFILSIYGLSGIAKKLKASKLSSTLVFYPLIFLVILNYFSFLNLVYKKQSTYLEPTTLHYQNISRWISENNNSKQDIVITNRFGQTQLAIPTYLNLSFDAFWENYDQVIMTHKILTFTSFDLQSELAKNDTIYIGFPGEFVGASVNHDSSDLPDSLELIDVLKSSDESVFHYGRDIWIVTSSTD